MSYKNNQLQHGMKNLNYLMNHILYQIFYNILEEHDVKKTDNYSIRIYVNKLANGIAYKINTGYYLELLTPETMKLLRSTKSKITKDKNGENVLHSEITESTISPL